MNLKGNAPKTSLRIIFVPELYILQIDGSGELAHIFLCALLFRGRMEDRRSIFIQCFHQKCILQHIRKTCHRRDDKRIGSDKGQVILGGQALVDGCTKQGDGRSRGDRRDDLRIVFQEEGLLIGARQDLSVHAGPFGINCIFTSHALDPLDPTDSRIHEAAVFHVHFQQFLFVRHVVNRTDDGSDDLQKQEDQCRKKERRCHSVHLEQVDHGEKHIQQYIHIKAEDHVREPSAAVDPLRQLAGGGFPEEIPVQMKNSGHDGRLHLPGYPDLRF